jgi:hypothetical protein
VTERKQCTQSSHSGRRNVYTASRRSSQHTAVVGQIVTECHRAGPFSEIWFVDLQLLEVQESAGQWQRACSEHLTICHVDLF